MFVVKSSTWNGLNQVPAQIQSGKSLEHVEFTEWEILDFIPEQAEDLKSFRGSAEGLNIDSRDVVDFHKELLSFDSPEEV